MREASSILRGQRVTVFSWVDFFVNIFQGTKSEKLTKPSEVFQMLARTVFTLDTSKTNIKLDKIFIL